MMTGLVYGMVHLLFLRTPVREKPDGAVLYSSSVWVHARQARRQASVRPSVVFLKKTTEVVAFWACGPRIFHLFYLRR